MDADALMAEARRDAGTTPESIFAYVLARFAYASDLATWGLDEHWATWRSEVGEQLARFGTFKGDCDDFAGICVFLARSAGLTARFQVCWDELGEYHCICTIADRWALDNRQKDVISIDALKRSGYRMHMASDTVPGGPWRYNT